mgnify:CR=1 FL=1
MDIGDETAADRQAIHGLVVEAFGGGPEADMVDRLRADGDLMVSLVARQGGRLCGYVALSRLQSPARAVALAPVAVSPGEQNRGIGSALVRAALERARALGTAIVFVLGKPGYYARFGFTPEAAEPFPCIYAGSHFMALRLSPDATPIAPVVYADAFATP